MKFEEWWENFWGPTNGRVGVNVREIARESWEAAQPKWQPIETAPKDLGDRIESFVLLSESGDVIHGGWYEEIDGEGVWFDRLYGEPIDDERITHWMLLPRPTKELEE